MKNELNTKRLSKPLNLVKNNLEYLYHLNNPMLVARYLTAVTITVADCCSKKI